MTTRVAVTGVGAITCLGRTAQETFAGLAEGRSGIGVMSRFATAGLKTTIAGEVRSITAERCRVRTHIMAETALEEALSSAGLAPDQSQLLEAPLCVGLTGWEFEWFDRREQQQAACGGSFLAQYRHPTNVDPTALDGSLLSGLQRRFRIQGPATGVTTACASGASAIELGWKAIRRGQTDLAIVGASDASVAPETVIRFSLLSALSRAHDEPARASKPFSKDRDGFVMSEGAAFLILESEARARARGAEILAFVVGVGSNADAFHRTRSRPDGSGGARCVARAIESAGLTRDAIGYVNAHGTSTPENDKMETLVLKSVFGAHAPRLRVSSNKSMLGHTLAAAGAVEAVATVLTLQRGVIPPTINYQQPDEQLDLDYVPNHARCEEIEFAISNSFGFGGQNVTVVFGRAP